jgi:RNA polymerase sigma-70 factor (ECF subfamily)
MSSSFSATRFPALPLREAKETAEPIYRGTSPVRSAEEPSDEMLIARVCADDSDALGLLFSRYARLVSTIGLRVLRSREEADDLLQDVFLLVRRRASAFDPAKGTVRSLLVQMCYQRAFSRRRDLARQNFHTSAEINEFTGALERPFTPSYDQGLEAHFGRTALQNALKTLSEEQYETLRLCFFEGYTLEEAAELLGQSYGNVRHHHYRGLAKLRQHLKAGR